METILSNKELNTPPLAEMSIYVENNILTCSFNVIGDIDFEIFLRKEYPSSAEAIQTATQFVNTQLQPPQQEIETSISFSEQQVLSKIALMEGLIGNSLPLPEKGAGYVYDGDVEYIESTILRLKERMKSKVE